MFEGIRGLTKYMKYCFRGPIGALGGAMNRSDYDDFQRVADIYKKGIDLNDPEEGNLSAARHVANMVMRMPNMGIKDASVRYKKQAERLYCDVTNFTQGSGYGMDTKGFDNFVSFARNCKGICLEHEMNTYIDASVAELNRIVAKGIDLDEPDFAEGAAAWKAGEIINWYRIVTNAPDNITAAAALYEIMDDQAEVGMEEEDFLAFAMTRKVIDEDLVLPSYGTLLYASRDKCHEPSDCAPQ